MVLQIGTVQQTLNPKLINPYIVVFAGDHGIAEEYISAYPQEVTNQMVVNFLKKGAAINVFSHQHQIGVQIVDAGVKYDFVSNRDLYHAKIDYGIKNFLFEKAMTQTQLHQCFSKADVLVTTLFQEGCNIIGFGEIGIGNTSAAAIIMSNLCQLPLEVCTGKGTVISNDQWIKKIEILKKMPSYSRYPY